MLVERLESYFGMSDTETAGYILKREQAYDESGLEDIYQWVITNRNRRFGFPDVSFMGKAFAAIKPRGEKTYFWAVCSECGGGYWNNLPYCPHCWEKGFLCSSRAVHTGKEKPPVNVIRYNKPYTGGIEKGQDAKELICYDCASREMSWCSWFGNPDHECREFRECRCKSCCVIAKKFNSQSAVQRKASFAVQFRKVV